MPLTRRQILSLIWTPIGLLNVPDTAKSQQLLQSPKRVRIINPYREQILDGLIGWWQLNTGSGSISYDSSGQGKNGTLVASPSWTTAIGGGGYALDLNGTTQWVTQTAGDYTTQLEGTVTAWINVDSVVNETIFSVQGSTSSDIWRFRVSTYLNVFSNSTSDSVRGATAISTGTTYHVAVTSTGTTWALYINGVAQSLTVLNGSNSGAWFGDTSGSGLQAVWGGAPSVNNQPFNGRLGGYRIYDRALSADEILAIANGTG